MGIEPFLVGSRARLRRSPSGSPAGSASKCKEAYKPTPRSLIAARLPVAGRRAAARRCTAPVGCAACAQDRLPGPARAARGHARHRGDRAARRRARVGDRRSPRRPPARGHDHAARRRPGARSRSASPRSRRSSASSSEGPSSVDAESLKPAPPSDADGLGGRVPRPSRHAEGGRHVDGTGRHAELGGRRRHRRRRASRRCRAAADRRRPARPRRRRAAAAPTELAPRLAEPARGAGHRPRPPAPSAAGSTGLADRRADPDAAGARHRPSSRRQRARAAGRLRRPQARRRVRRAGRRRRGRRDRRRDRRTRSSRRSPTAPSSRRAIDMIYGAVGSREPRPATAPTPRVGDRGRRRRRRHRTSTTCSSCVLAVRAAPTCTSPPGSPPIVRVNGELRPIDEHPGSSTAREIQRDGVRRSLTQKQREKFEDEPRARLRLRACRAGPASASTSTGSATSLGAAFRVIPYEIKPLEDARRPAGGRELRRRCRVASCSSPARPVPASRRRSPSLVDIVNRDAQRPHHDGRGPDRVPAPPQDVRWSTSARSARTRTPSPTRSSTCCARTPTSSSSVRCVTSRRSRSR